MDFCYHCAPPSPRLRPLPATPPAEWRAACVSNSAGDSRGIAGILWELRLAPRARCGRLASGAPPPSRPGARHPAPIPPGRLAPPPHPALAPSSDVSDMPWGCPHFCVAAVSQKLLPYNIIAF